MDHFNFNHVHGESPSVSTDVEDAVRRTLDSIPGADVVLTEVALKLAKQVDQGGNVAAASRELRMCMNALRDSDSAVVADDDLDELQAKRDARRKANG